MADECPCLEYRQFSGSIDGEPRPFCAAAEEFPGKEGLGSEFVNAPEDE